VIRVTDIPHAVQWHDGMLLSPHHFQETSTRHERLLAYHLHHAAPYHYGTHHLEIDHGLLVSGTFRLLEAEAIMPDGLLIHHTAQDPQLQLDLKPYAADMRAGPVSIYLAIPRAHLGAAAGGELARHRSIHGTPVPDANTGDTELEIPRLVPNLRLIAAAEPPARFTCLPIARVRIDGEAFVRADYIPPLLATSLTSPLGQLCSYIVARLREKALRLADKLGALSISTDRPIITELKRQIDCLIAALPPFEAMLQTDQSHPYPLYIALTALVGRLSAIARSPVPPILPMYRHDDILAAFQTARDHLYRMIDEGILESFTAHPLDLDQGRFLVDFQRPWKGRTIVLAIKGRRGVPETELFKWMNGALIGAAGKAREMREARVLGVPRKRVDRQGDLIATTGTFLFELDEASPYLEPGEQLAVFNPADPAAAAGPTELILYVKTLS